MGKTNNCQATKLSRGLFTVGDPCQPVGEGLDGLEEDFLCGAERHTAHEMDAGGLTHFERESMEQKHRFP